MTQYRPTAEEFAAVPRVKASASADTGQCVEIARVYGWTAFSDSKNPELVQVECPPADWAMFLRSAKAGAFDL